MYRKSVFMEKFEFVESTIPWKFSGKLCTLDGQKVRIHRKIQIRCMYNIVKIQWKTMYNRCTKSLDSFKNSNSLNVQYRENSKANSVYLMYKKSRIVKKIEFIKCTILLKFNGKLSTLNGQMIRNTWKNSDSLNVRNHENSIEIYVH